MRRAPLIAATVTLMAAILAPVSAQTAATGAAKPEPKTEAGMAGVKTDAKAKTVVGLQSIPTVPDIDFRQRRLTKRVNDSVLYGRLTAREADDFKKLLDQIATEEADYRVSDGILTPLEVLKITLELDTFSRLLENQLRDRKVAILDIDAAHDELQTRIMENIRAGRLTPREIELIKTELLASMALSDYMRADSRLTYGESLTLSLDIDAIANQLQKLLERRLVVVPSTETMQAHLEKNIADGLASGKLNAETAETLKKDIAAVLDLPQMTQEDSVIVAMELDRLDHKIETLTGVRKPFVYDVAKRQREIGSAIAQSLDVGRLSPSEAYEFKQEMDAIFSRHNTTAGGATQVSDAEKLHQTGLELETLAGRLNATLHDPTAFWPGVDAFQSRIDHRLKDAVHYKRMTEEDAKALAAEADRLGALEKTHRESGNTLELNEALEVAMGMQRINLQLQHKLKDRNVVVPEIDKLENELYKLIANGIDTGALDPDEDVKLALNRISALKNKTNTPSTSTLDNNDKLIVATEIERLKAMVDREIKGKNGSNIPLRGRAQLIERRINDGIATARLTKEQADALKSELSKLSSVEEGYRLSTPGLTADESLELLVAYSQMAAKVDDKMRENGVSPAELLQRLNELRLRVGEATFDGLLTLQQADEFQRNVNNALENTAKARAMEGGLSYAEGLRLAYDLERLSGNIEAQVRETPVALLDVEARQMVLDMQLANSLAAGQISADQARQLRNQLHEIEQLELRYRSTGGGFSNAEHLAVSMDLDRLGAAMNHTIGRNKTFPDIDTRQAQLLAKIKGLTSSGRLTAAEAAALNADLDRIAESEAAFRITEEGLTFQEALTLSLDLDRLSSRLDQVPAKPLAPQTSPRKANENRSKASTKRVTR
jgi:hypothetical protein